LQLSGHQDRFTIKLRGVGYRLVYEVCDSQLIVVEVASASGSGMRFTRLSRNAEAVRAVTDDYMRDADCSCEADASSLDF
jgi:hypothetical protein